MSEPSTQAQFVVTKQYRRFAEFCDACRRYRYIGLCYGPPGVGKTLSARHYAQWEFVEPYILAFSESTPPPELSLCRAIVYTPTVHNTPRLITQEVRRLTHGLSWAVTIALEPEVDHDFVRENRQRTALIIVDEADRLKVQGLEQIRDIYDRDGVGMVLIGMPGLEKRLARYAQLYSRVGFVHQFLPLSTEDVIFLLERQWEHLGFTLSQADFTDSEATAAITRITGGNFRLLQRLFTQIERILQINDLGVITKEVVEAARESLVIGPL
jgi:DNA transposition AAA+ family ATPase